MALTLVPRAIPLRPASRDGLRGLAAAWRVTQAPVEGRPAVRVVTAPTAGWLSDTDASLSETGAEPPYWPDGPSAA